MSISETTVKYVARSFLCRTRYDLAVERSLKCRGGIVLPCRCGTTFVSVFFFVFVIILPYLRVFFIVADIIAPIIYQLNVVFLTL